MKIYEITAMSRSGHHSVYNWIIRNITGIQCTWNFKMNIIGDQGFHYLNESNHDIPSSFHFIEERLEHIDTLFVGYEDTPSDYTIFREDNVFNGPMSLSYYKKYNMDYSGRIILIRDFYNNLSSRIKSNENKLFSKWKSNDLHLFNVEDYFISLWKDSAKSCLKNKFSYLKFEDWLYNKDIREKFLWDNFRLKDLHGIENLIGTTSSFETVDGINERFKKVEIPKNIIEKVNSDKELKELILEMGYEYREL